MSAHGFHICSFSALDELPKKLRGNRKAVLKVLAKTGRFSTFEIEGKLCYTMTWIMQKSGWVKNTGGQFPWTTIELTDEGKAVLAHIEGDATP